MTATATRRTSADDHPSTRVVHNGVRRTLLALLASALGIIPLKGLFSDYGWLVDVWLTMIIVLGPAALLRRRRPPGALDIWPGIVLMIPWLTVRFVSEHAIAGFIPGSATWHDVSLLLTDLHDTTRNDVAPIHTTVAVRLVICALLGLVAALIDLVAVVGRRGALAGVPLLVIYTVAGAVPRAPVSWFWFAFAAVGYLLLLGLDSEDDLLTWGRRIRPPKASRGANVVSVTTPRIAIVAVVVAIALPLLVPAQSRNLIANAFHGSNGGGSGITGFGGGAAGSIAPFAALQGQLNRPTPVTLMTVRMKGKSAAEPFYLRVNVLNRFTGTGWQADGHGSEEPLSSTGFQTIPASGGANSVQLQAEISLTDQVRGPAPVFAVPTRVDGLSGGTTWNPQDQLLLGDQITGSTDYTETFRQPEPTTNQLMQAGESDSADLQRSLTLPDDFPAYATDLADRLTRQAATPYAKARAINAYFTDPNNGFVYDTQTKAGDSGSALVDFLKNKQGYCQQFAAAEAAMLRKVGVPSRVVLGYMHPATDSKGKFTVTTSEAHSWVESYFDGIGWIPFDPTPTVGLVGGAKSDLAWARHPYSSGSVTAPQPTISRSSSAPANQPSAATSSAAAPNADGATTVSGSSLAPLWWTLGGLLVVLLVLSPAAARMLRRRSRYLAARRDGDADALWAELSDTALDLGYVWSSARSPRQVAGWLAKDTRRSAAQLRALADAVEQERYSPPGRPRGGTATLSDDLRSVTGELRSNRGRSARLRAALWPASLGWGSRSLGVRGRRGARSWHARRR